MFRHRRRMILIALIGIFAFVLPARRTTCAPSGSPKSRPRPKLQTVKKRAAAPTSPVTLVQNAPPDYLSGEANVNVRGNQNPVVRLGMAQHGVTMIEFPANDRFFAIHPGDSNLVTTDCRKKGEDGDCTIIPTDHFLVLRAGSGFVTLLPTTPAQTKRAGRKKEPPPPTPATSIIVQMQSGIVLTFLMYPVAQLSQQAHRCVINYDRAEVIAARRKAGLAVNLDDAEPTTTAIASATPASAPPSPSLSASALSAPTPVPTPVPPDLPATTAPAIVEVERRAKKLQVGLADPAAIAKTALTQATKDPKQFKRWTPPVHGLSLSTVSRDIGEHARLVIVAVRNMNREAVRVMPGHPEMFVETRGDGGRPVQIERVKKLHAETTTTSSVLPAGAVVYYALVYETPILGAKQHLRVAVGHRSAADEPAAAAITAAAR